MQNKKACPQPTGDKMRDIMTRLWKEEEGQDLVEYGLLVVLIALFAVVAMQSLANGISDALSNATAQLTSGT
jgi:pilus assembly protein Flp/PilA